MVIGKISSARIYNITLTADVQQVIWVHVQCQPGQRVISTLTKTLIPVSKNYAAISFQPMSVTDHRYIYGLLETTMRGYVEAVWGKWEDDYWLGILEDALHRSAIHGICDHGARVGAVWKEKHVSHHLIELICVEPRHQNRGVGEAALKIILLEAATESKSVRLRVLAPNPAKRLYERLGFVVTEATPERFYMEHHVR